MWGVDLGKGFHQVAMVDERKERVGEPYRIGRGRAGTELVLKRAKLCGARPEEVVVTIEATGDYWRELVWAFVNAGCRVYLAQPKKAHDLRKFYVDHTKTDITDAEALARMPLVDEGLRPVWVAPAAEQMLLRLCRLRWKYRCRMPISAHPPAERLCPLRRPEVENLPVPLTSRSCHAVRTHPCVL